MLTTIQAAKLLIDAKTGKPVCRSRVIALIRSGRLPATKFGNAWMIDERDLDAVKVRVTGYPKGKPRKKTTHTKEQTK